MKRIPAWLAALLSLSGCQQPEPSVRRAANFLVVGHRGAPKEAAENTIPAVHAAVAAGANAVELDVCVTADGHFVVWHDRDPNSPAALARQTVGEGLLYKPQVPAVGAELRKPVEQLTLQQLLASHHYAGADGATQAIVTWDEMLDVLRQESALLAVYVDVKVEDVASALRLFDTLHGIDKRFILLSQVETVVVALRDAGAEVAWDFEKSGARAESVRLGLRHASTGLTITRLKTEYFSDIADLISARELGELDFVTAWTIDDPDDMRALRDAGVNAILTNEPALLRDI